jgi:hypothetical protein
VSTNLITSPQYQISWKSAILELLQAYTDGRKDEENLIDASQDYNRAYRNIVGVLKCMRPVGSQYCTSAIKVQKFGAPGSILRFSYVISASYIATLHSCAIIMVTGLNKCDSKSFQCLLHSKWNSTNNFWVVFLLLVGSVLSLIPVKFHTVFKKLNWFLCPNVFPRCVSNAL